MIDSINVDDAQLKTRVEVEDYILNFIQIQNSVVCDGSGHAF